VPLPGGVNFMSISEHAKRIGRALATGDERAWSWVATSAAFGLLVGALVYVLGPMLEDFSTYGFHDWDIETAWRAITVIGLREYGEGPWWNPYQCGGVPAWGHVEGASNLVSPYLPLYLLSDVRTAIRIEVLGQGLVGLVGTYLFAGCFSRSAALRALLAALFVLNGRWSLQAAVGHTWHLQYGLLPWAFYFFERSQAPGKLRWAIAAGVVMALQCFWGAIYPLPHTALLLSGYALLTALFGKTWRPLLGLAIAGPVALGLSAPKLFAVVDHMSDVPRLIDSNEVIGLAELVVMLTAPDQRYGVHSVRVPAYNWHEWGLYVGGGGLLVLILGVLFARGTREHSLKILGLLCLLLGFGAFHPSAPWTLLHRLPFFASQHVPSRFHFPMLLLLGAAFVAFAATHLDDLVRRRPWLDLVLLLPVAVIAWDMARFSRTPFEQAFWMEAPEDLRRAERFEHSLNPSVHYVRRDWAAPILLSMFANRGVIRCYGFDPNYKPGAIAKQSPEYRGLAWVAEGEGTARVVEWTTNRAVVEVSGARAGAVVAYDMNYDSSWRADGEPALDYAGVVAGKLVPGSNRIEFSYFPRTLAWSVPLSLLTLALCSWRRRYAPLLRAWVVALGRFWPRQRPSSAERRAEGRP
jgi:hypothetical protein